MCALPIGGCPPGQTPFRPATGAGRLRYTPQDLLLCVKCPEAQANPMPLPPSKVSRQPLHTRSIRVQSYGRDDGLWDLEAELIDLKAYDFPKHNGDIFRAGRPIHHMHLRITIAEALPIVAAQAVYAAAPHQQPYQPTHTSQPAP